MSANASPMASDSNQPQPASDDGDHAGALFEAMAVARLRGRARWAGLILIATIALPIDVLGTVPVFVWDVIADVPLASALGLVALPLAGLAIVVAGVVTRRGASLGFAVLASLALATVWRKLGAERGAWATSALPESLASRPAGALVALACVAAAANLRFRPRTRHVAAWVYGAGVLAALGFYAWPHRGEAPLRMVVRALGVVPELPDVRFQLGVLVIAFLALWPLAVVGLGASILRSTPSKDESWLAIVASWGMPLWLSMLVVRVLASPQGGFGLLAFLGTIAVVAAVVGLLSGAIVVVVEGVVRRNDAESFAASVDVHASVGLGANPYAAPSHLRVDPAPARAGLPLARAASVAMGALIVLASSAAWVARPPRKGTDWSITAATPEGDMVFGEHLLQWSRARRAWDIATKQDAAGAQQRVELKARGKTLTDAARALDPKVGEALVALTSSSDELDLRGYQWGRLVDEVNRANQAARQPYFLDPDVMTRVADDGLRQHFFVYPYQIDQVAQYDVDGRLFAALRVRQLGHDRETHFRLGFSRDEQPFALVVLDETERLGKELVELAAKGACREGVAATPDLHEGLGRCGELLAASARGREQALRDAVVAGTERHELQHQIDGPHLPLAGPVASLLEGYTAEAQDRVNREVSAFLVELAGDDLVPRLALLQLAQYLLDRGTVGGIYPTTSVVVFEALGGRTIRRGAAIDGDRFWRLYAELLELPDAELRSRARATWANLFDAPLAAPKPR